MSQFTKFMTIIEEVICDEAPTQADREYLQQNGFYREGKTWKRTRRAPTTRHEVSDLTRVLSPVNRD